MRILYWDYLLDLLEVFVLTWDPCPILWLIWDPYDGSHGILLEGLIWDPYDSPYGCLCLLGVGRSVLVSLQEGPFYLRFVFRPLNLLKLPYGRMGLFEPRRQRHAHSWAVQWCAAYWAPSKLLSSSPRENKIHKYMSVYIYTCICVHEYV